MQSNPWDILGQKTFNTEFKEGEIDPRAADNILLAWPPILKLIQANFPSSKGIQVLDFGCGAGGFCNKLDSLGFKVTGLDLSIGMIESAKLHTSPTIQYILGDQNKLPINTSFHAIVSIMTFPFINNIESTFQILSDLLEPQGLFIIAVFNPEWVKESLKKNIWFLDFDSIENPKVGWKTFGELKTPIYIRNAEEYEAIAKRFRLKRVQLKSPNFTRKFIQRYPDYYPNNVSEYIILGFQKEK